MEKNIAHTLKYGERVTSSYAEIYLDDSYCEFKTRSKKSKIKEPKKSEREQQFKNSEWTSPSDLLIGIVDLMPPFTSKITRGKTHEGILAIGNDILEKERARFLKLITTLSHDNDAAWNQILQQERATVEKKVKNIYHNIFRNKSKIMTEEIATFYEDTLQKLEDHLRSELQRVLLSLRSNTISALNIEIKLKLDKEKNVLQKVLQQRYESEVYKIKTYYKLLLQNEIHKKNQLIHHAMIERNDALKAFCRQVDADNITSTIYVMCTERKKCKIKQFILENYQNTEIKEKLQKLKERQEIVDVFAKREITLNDINSEWEGKVKRILQLFLKFVSFSLKLLPEQTTFLLDFQKMVVLQLNEIHKMPQKCSSILIPEEKLQNIFKFDEPEIMKPVCKNEPFVIVGDTSDIPLAQYGSRETLPSDVDLPTIRLQRQFVYAKCHKFEQIKDLLEKERCKCSDIPAKESSHASASNITSKQIQQDVCIECESSNELLLVEDIHRLHECPIRGCKDWAKKQSFPFLADYLDFTEENYERVKTLLGKPPKEEIRDTLINPKSIVYSDLLFGPTKETFHTVETQYSSQEELNKVSIECPCIEISGVNSNICNRAEESINKVSNKISQEPESVKMFNKIIIKRQNSLKRLLHDNPNLLKMFNDESFGFE